MKLIALAKHQNLCHYVLDKSLQKPCQIIGKQHCDEMIADDSTFWNNPPQPYYAQLLVGRRIFAQAGYFTSALISIYRKGNVDENLLAHQ